MSEVKKGWAAMTQFIYGDDLSWSTQQIDGIAEPSIYESKREVQIEIAGIIVAQLEEFMAGVREWNEVQLNPDYYPVYIEVQNGYIKCWTDEHKEHQVFWMNLQEWREGL